MLTVITPATSKNLTTIAAVKEDLQLVAGTEDAWLTRAIASASAAIERYVGRTLAREGVEETFRPECRVAGLTASRWPICHLLGVEINGVPIDVSEIEVAASSGLFYRLDGAGKRRILWASLPVTLRYSAGWIMPGEVGYDLPADIEQACIIAVRHRWYARSHDPIVRSEKVEGIGEQALVAPPAAALPAEAMALLDPYSVPWFG